MGFQLFTLVAKCFIAAWWIHYHLVLTITHFLIAKPRCISINPLFLSCIILYLINLITQQIIYFLIFIYYFDIGKLSLLVRQINVSISWCKHSNSHFALKIAFLIVLETWGTYSARFEIHGVVDFLVWNNSKQVFELFWS